MEAGTDPRIQAAHREAAEAYDRHFKAYGVYLAASARAVQLEIERLAVKYPTLSGLDVEISAEYDDEGHYPERVRVEPAFSDGEPVPSSDDWYDVSDEVNDTLGLSPDLARFLAGADEVEDNFAISLEDLRERKF